MCAPRATKSETNSRILEDEHVRLRDRSGRCDDQPGWLERAIPHVERRAAESGGLDAEPGGPGLGRVHRRRAAGPVTR